MKIIKLNNSNQFQVLNEAIVILNSGGLVVYPTETCYGLGADATNQSAVEKLLSYKKKREGKPLSVLVLDRKMAEEYVFLNQSAKNFYRNFLPGPVTVISKGKHKLAKGIESELGNLGIRISSYPLTAEMIKLFKKPITATSANASNRKKPYQIDDILANLSLKQKDKLDLIIDAGILPKRKSSTVVDTTLLGNMILRQGDLDLGKEIDSIISQSVEETINLAQTTMLKYWNKLRHKGIVIALIGDLGTGKTVFAKGVGKFLQIKQAIVSPSFTLLNEYVYQRYDTKGTFYHFDPWRLDSFAEFLKLNFKSQLKPNNILLIEWANKFMDQLADYLKPSGIHFIKIGFKDLGGDKRKIDFYI